MSGSVAHAGRYTMIAALGPSETMYTPAEAAKQHPKSGEVMLRGEMMMGGPGGRPSTMGMGSPTTMGMGSPSTTGMGSPTTMQSTMTTAPMTGDAVTRHLEVHVCTTSDGKVVVNGNPTITLRDAAGGMATSISVATMQGIGQGANDVHYGNNVAVLRGHHYIVEVDLAGAVGRFSLTA